MSAIIEAENLTKKFDDFIAVDGISLKIPKGKVFGFLGPNGAGKTTSLKMLTGLLVPNAGKIIIDGKDPNKSSDNQKIKNMLGLIPQDIVIWEDLTVQENLEFVASIYKVPKDEAKERIDKLIKEIHLEEKRKVLAKKLSGGLKRRLNVIMALVHEPSIVVCDEPTPGLDPQSRTLVWEFIQDLTRVKGKTVILTTHFMEEADRLSDVVAIIDAGKILVTDTPDNLKNSIGEGDLIEIHINQEDLLDEALERLENFEGLEHVQLLNSTLLVRTLNAPKKLASILNRIEAIEGLEVTDMKIRKTTLEDVFLHLTGRNLRE
ncbi:MAG: ABC transporter ATP-binding protein [Candidatus Heimdallarchaeota archaeon]|nr:ABC transporter ATP-binding protein [Candidatus Heimdallarchaeota archaeon]